MGEVVEMPRSTATEARLRADRIQTGLELMWQLIGEAYLARDWEVLGYGSWDEYCTREFGTSRLQLPREERQEVIASLRESGLSTRAIAAVTGVDHSTVSRSLNRGGAPSQQNAPPAQRPVSSNNGQLGIDGKVYPLRPRPPAPHPEPPKPPPAVLALPTHDGRHIPYVKPQARATFNQTDGDGISWAKWSWNPVTGCLHGCDYCYARAIANRWTDAYPAGFTPLFHFERLDAPANTIIPGAHRDDSHPNCSDGDCHICQWRRVFVCSMADLYGRWVPGEWIEQVHAAMLTAPQFQYILLTKFPDRYTGLTMPPGAWVGTSVDEQKRVRIAERAFREVDAAVKWLSLEPLREPLEFADLSMFDWVVIGAQTATQQPDGNVPAFAPDAKWVVRITQQAIEAGCKVHWKPNLRANPGMRWLDEYPEGN